MPTPPSAKKSVSNGSGPFVPCIRRIDNKAAAVRPRIASHVYGRHLADGVAQGSSQTVDEVCPELVRFCKRARRPAPDAWEWARLSNDHHDKHEQGSTFFRDARGHCCRCVSVAIPLAPDENGMDSGVIQAGSDHVSFRP